MPGGGRSDQIDVDRTLRNHVDRIRALEATPLPTGASFDVGAYIVMRATLPAVAANTATDTPWPEITAVDDVGGLGALPNDPATSVPSPYAGTHYSWDSGIDATLVNVLTSGTYSVGMQAWFGNGTSFPTADFNAYVHKTGLGGEVWSTQQPGNIMQQQHFEATFNFSPPIPFDNAGIDYWRTCSFDNTTIGVGISFGINIAHDHPDPLDVGVSLYIAKIA